MPTTRDVLDRHLPFQRAEWRVQLTSSWLILLFVIAAAAGLFGDGPLASAQAVSTGGKSLVRYDRLTRRGTSTRWTFEADLPAGTPALRIQVDRNFTEYFHLQGVQPEPERAESSASGLTYTFPVAPDAGRASVVFDMKPRSVGYTKVRLAIGNDTVEVPSFTYF